MKFLTSISPIELGLIAVAITFILAAELDFDEMNVIGNFFIGIGGLLVVIASQGQFLKGIEDAKSRKELLEKQLALLQEQRI